MKLMIGSLCLLVLAVAAQAYPGSWGSYSSVGWPVSSSSTVWPAYGGLYGKAAITKYAYPASPVAWGGAWPSYGKSWGYGVPTVATGGLWNYGGYGQGWGYKNYW
ncbi:shematrin-like protein 1 [Malaya genurostris]|uniref:shematrin-like protein 1 n=1 Tax=Malaya genurostris TaxID=325434 RepID=UPI0026F39E73|nr:shematrin-like protein 1 [Malaya genurostris]